MRVGPAVNSLFEGEIQVKDKTRGAELRCLLTKSTFIREAKHACVFLQHVRDDERESAPPAALDQPVEQYRAQAHALEVRAYEQGKLGAALCECVGARNGEHFRLAAARSAAPDQGNPPFWINKHQLIEYVRRKSPNSAEEAHPQVVRLGPLNEILEQRAITRLERTQTHPSARKIDDFGTFNHVTLRSHQRIPQQARPSRACCRPLVRRHARLLSAWRRSRCGAVGAGFRAGAYWLTTGGVGSDASCDTPSGPQWASARVAVNATQCGR